MLLPHAQAKRMHTELVVKGTDGQILRQAIATAATRPDGPAGVAPPARSHAEVERGVRRLPFSKSQRCYLPKSYLT